MDAALAVQHGVSALLYLAASVAGAEGPGGRMEAALRGRRSADVLLTRVLPFLLATPDAAPGGGTLCAEREAETVSDAELHRLLRVATPPTRSPRADTHPAAEARAPRTSASLAAPAPCSSSGACVQTTHILACDGFAVQLVVTRLFEQLAVPASGSSGGGLPSHCAVAPFGLTASVQAFTCGEVSTACGSSHVVVTASAACTSGAWCAAPSRAASGVPSGRSSLRLSHLAALTLDVHTVTVDGGRRELGSSTVCPHEGAPALPTETCASVGAVVPSTAVLHAQLTCVEVRSVAREGHTLCAAVPSTPGSVVHVWLLDRTLGGVKDVVCPSHATTTRRTRAAQSGQSTHLEVIIGGPACVYTGVHDALSSCAVLLVEPGDASCAWDGLLSPPSQVCVSDGTGESHTEVLQVQVRAPTRASIPLGLLGWLGAGDVAWGAGEEGGGAEGVPRTLTQARAGLSTSPPPPPPVASVVDASSLPRHIAVVMDGNGRWAKARGLPRAEGHRAGVNTIHAIIRACRRLRIPYLTLYAFSAQNWSRPPAEVAILMALLDEFVSTDLRELTQNGVRLRVIGEMDKLPGKARRGLQSMITTSAGNTGLTLILALSYGGREEVAAAAAAAASAAARGTLDPSTLADPATFRTWLPLPDVPDPDLLIRTSGELRLSNFLLWHVAYTELYVVQTLWPDFDEEQLGRAVAEYAKRERRFGKTSEQVAEGGAAKAVVGSAGRATSVQTTTHVYGSTRRLWGCGALTSTRGLGPAWAAVAVLLALLAYDACTLAGGLPHVGVWRPVSTRHAHTLASTSSVLLGRTTHTRTLPGRPSPTQQVGGAYVVAEHSDACVLWHTHSSGGANASVVVAGGGGGGALIRHAPASGAADRLRPTPPWRAAASGSPPSMPTGSCNFSGWARAGAATDTWGGGGVHSGGGAVATRYPLPDEAPALAPSSAPPLYASSGGVGAHSHRSTGP